MMQGRTAKRLTVDREVGGSSPPPSILSPLFCDNITQAPSNNRQSANKKSPKKKAKNHRGPTPSGQQDKSRRDARVIECWFDGACEPRNPGGTAAFGAVIFVDGERVWECSRVFHPKKGRERETSNNVAEYSGFKAILDWLLEHGYQDKRIIVRGDSNLVIQQMFGFWRIKQGYYVPIARECKKLVSQFSRLSGAWVPRDENDIADELSKRELLRANVQFKIQPET